MVQRTYSQTLEDDPFAALQKLILCLRDGDVIVVSDLDDFTPKGVLRQVLFGKLIERGIRLRVRRIAPEHSAEFATYRTAARRARFDRAIGREAYANCKGRTPTIDPQAVRRLKDDGVMPGAIAERLGIGRASVYRALAA